MSDLIQHLLEGDDQLPLEVDHRTSLTNSDLILAARALIAKPTIKQVALRQKVLSRLFSILMRSQRADLTQIAATSLVEIGSHEINKTILDLIANPQTPLAVSQTLVYALIRQRKYYAIKTLLQILSGNIDPSLVATVKVNISYWSINNAFSHLEDDERRKLIGLYRSYFN